MPVGAPLINSWAKSVSTVGYGCVNNIHVSYRNHEIKFGFVQQWHLIILVDFLQFGRWSFAGLFNDILQNSGRQVEYRLYAMPPIFAFMCFCEKTPV